MSQVPTQVQAEGSYLPSCKSLCSGTADRTV